MLTEETSRSRRGAFVAVLVLVGVGIWIIGDRTAYFATTGDDEATRIEFSVRVRNYRHDLDDAAASLWYACVGVINWDHATAPERVADNRFVATVSPSLGEDSSRRFRGCIQDGTIDKVRGSVVRIEGVELPDAFDEDDDGDDD